MAGRAMHRYPYPYVSPDETLDSQQRVDLNPINEVREEKCWLEGSYKCHDNLESKIRAKHDHVDLLRSTSEILQNLPARDAACLHRWLLIYAIRYNHIALVNTMLADETIVHNAPVHCRSHLPIFFAIEKGDVALVEIFLRAGSQLTVPTDFRYSANNCRQHSIRQASIADDSEQISYVYEFDVPYLHLYEVLSAVEYACLVNQPQVLKLLVAYTELGLYKPRPTVNIKTATVLGNMWISHRPQDTNLLPLHVTISLLTKVYDPTVLHRIPTYVQVIIDAGASIHSVDVRGRTPLEFLMSRVNFLRLEDHVYATTHQQVVMEITEILLKAGACVVGGRKSLHRTGCDPLNAIAAVILTISRSLLSLYRSESDLFKACIVRDLVQLAKDLTKLLLVNGAKLTDPNFSSLIPTAALYIMDALQCFCFLPSSAGTASNEDYNYAAGTSVCIEIMDSLSSLFRCFVIAGYRSLTNKDWSEFLDTHLFISSFINIANYSQSADGRSEKLVRMMLSALSASAVNKLRHALVQNDAKDPITNSRYSRQQVDEALKYLGDVVAPNAAPESLKYLTVRAIRRALPCRVLLGDESLGVGLPSELDALVRRYE